MLLAKDYRQRARKTLEGRWLEAVLVCFIGALLGGVSVGGTFGFQFGHDGGINLQLGNHVIYSFPLPFVFAGIVAAIASVAVVYRIATAIIGAAVELGVAKYFTKQACGLETDIKDEFSCFSFFGKALGLRIVMAVFIALWTLLLVIPGIIAAYRYSMAVYLMAENPQLGIMEAIDESKRIMDGNKWRLFCLDLSFIGWAILSAITFGIGFLFLEPYMQSARAHFYLENKSRKK